MCYFLLHFIEDWGLDFVRMIKHFKFWWCANCPIRLTDLQFDELFVEYLSGLDTLAIRLGPDEDGHWDGIEDRQATEKSYYWTKRSAALRGPYNSLYLTVTNTTKSVWICS